jgi:hypothetical protein
VTVSKVFLRQSERGQITPQTGVEQIQTLRMTPAEAAGLIKSAMMVSDIVDLIDAQASPPKPRGPYKPRQPKVAA